MGLRLLAAGLAAIPATCLAAPPPPPPPPDYIAKAADVLSTSSTTSSFAAYSAMLADDPHVFIDDRPVASDKMSWLVVERARLDKVDRRVLGYAEGQDNVLVIDEFDDRSRLPAGMGMVFDARFITRAARYQFGQDRLIHEIRFVQTEGFLKAKKEDR